MHVGIMHKSIIPLNKDLFYTVCMVPKVDHQNPSLSSRERAAVWIHRHPTIVKIVVIAAAILGIGLLASLPFTALFLGGGCIAAIAVGGGVLTLASSIALLILDILIPPHHNMANHAFKPGECEGGRLYYDGDVPILSLNSDDPYKAGEAHGYLCGSAISHLSRRFAFILHTLARQPRADQLSPELLADIRQKIPDNYLLEMQGLLEGYNKWAKEYWWQLPKKITLDDILLFHLMPDSVHFHPNASKRAQKERESSKTSPLLACTAIVDRDENGGLVFLRNMDWPSFGLAGTYSLVIHRKHRDHLCSTLEVGTPGLVGTLTGMNSQGLGLGMNVCSGSTWSIRGMPASFYNRACLENCQSVEGVEKFTRDNPPLGPYHLTVADAKQASSIHFYQSPGNTHVIRPKEDNRPLATLNCRYDPNPNCDMHNSRERQSVIDRFFQKMRPREEVLGLPFVNNWITTHRVVMKPQLGTLQVAFDNAFAGKGPLHTVSTKNLFR